MPRADAMEKYACAEEKGLPASARSLAASETGASFACAGLASGPISALSAASAPAATPMCSSHE
jgi:hypothetical protein